MVNETTEDGDFPNRRFLITGLFESPSMLKDAISVIAIGLGEKHPMSDIRKVVEITSKPIYSQRLVEVSVRYE